MKKWRALLFIFVRERGPIAKAVTKKYAQAQWLAMIDFIETEFSS
jgi:hypothetical protein